MTRVIQGINDFETWCIDNNRLDLLAQWDYDKNERSPKQFTKGSNKKVWWKCSKGHSFDMCIYNRTTKNLNCPYCGSQRLLKGYNDLATIYPTIASEWDNERNSPLMPYDVMSKSNKKAWWKCSKGHSYQSKICHRTDGHDCPYCSGLKPIIGVNDLKTRYPDLCKQWNIKKNKVGPEEYLPSSNKKVWWKCENGHSWSAVISSRVNNGRGCPLCWKESHTSFNEQAVFFYIHKLFPDAINSDHTAIGMELDVFIPSIMTAIEYDGAFWHSDKDKTDIKKNKLCIEKGIELIRLREHGLSDLTEASNGFLCLCIPVVTKETDYVEKLENDYEGLEKALFYIISFLKRDITPDFINIKRDKIEIMSEYISLKKNNSLSKQHPEISKEWNYDKNGSLIPDMFLPHSNKKVWWKCLKGHEWESMISQRVRGRGCPYCSSKKVLVGYNDFATTEPDLLKEWDREKNTILPNEIVRGSHLSVWWKCVKCGYEWKSIVSSRTIGNRGCPECGKIKNHKSQLKAVMNTDTGDVYESAKAASQATGISRSNIRNNCNGRSKSAGGFHWKYVE